MDKKKSSISKAAQEDLRNFCIRNKGYDYTMLKLELFYYASGRMPDASISDVQDLIDKIVKEEV